MVTCNSVQNCILCSVYVCETCCIQLYSRHVYSMLPRNKNQRPNSKSKNQKLRTKNRKPKTENQKPKPRTKDSEPRTKNQNRGLKTKPRTKNREPKTEVKNQKPKTKIQEAKTQKREPKTKNQNPRICVYNVCVNVLFWLPQFLNGIFTTLEQFQFLLNNSTAVFSSNRDMQNYWPEHISIHVAYFWHVISVLNYQWDSDTYCISTYSLLVMRHASLCEIYSNVGDCGLLVCILSASASIQPSSHIC